jgi:hypothetical protein
MAVDRRPLKAILDSTANSASLGHDALYLYTERLSAAQALYERLGWQTISTGHYEDIFVA